MEYKIQDAKIEDARPVRSIARDAWIRLYPNEEYGITKEDIEAIDWFNKTRQEKVEKEILEKYETVRTWVVKDDEGEVFGFCKATKMEDKGEVMAIYVIPEIEGKGWGKKLLNKALEWLGNTDIVLSVVSYNNHAISFYERNGFVKAGEVLEYDGTKPPSGKNIPRIEMLKKKKS